jgi:polar amino acid transport system substrate-binding protein
VKGIKMKNLSSSASPLSGESGSVAAEPARKAREIAPIGTLRVGVVEAPTRGAFFVARDRPDEPVRGVTVDLGAKLADQLDIPVRYNVFPNSGACTEALHLGDIDVAFMPVDSLRASQVAFGPAYFLLESTYLVSGPSGIRHLAEVDRPGVRVVGVANTTTIRAATRTLMHTVPVPVTNVEAAFQAMLEGQADAVALSRDSLAPLLTVMPGSCIVAGGFQQTAVSIAVPPARPAALEYVNYFLENAKSDGTVRRIFDLWGLHDEAVASAGRWTLAP